MLLLFLLLLLLAAPPLLPAHALKNTEFIHYDEDRAPRSYL
jgi:hypothetical protein